MTAKFESLIGLHCAPTIMRIKPANLFSWQNSYNTTNACFDEIISTYKEKFISYGISLEVLCKCKKHTLIYLYRNDLLQEHLQMEESQKILAKYQYNKNSNIEEQISSLKKHLSEQNTFPHEIGLFLGYPPEDVLGFIENNGAKCKLCGEWKVYGEPLKAKNLFNKYNDCRKYFSEKINNGFTLSEIINEVSKRDENIALVA